MVDEKITQINKQSLRSSSFDELRTAGLSRLPHIIKLSAKIRNQSAVIKQRSNGGSNS